MDFFNEPNDFYTLSPRKNLKNSKKIKKIWKILKFNLILFLEFKKLRPQRFYSNTKNIRMCQKLEIYLNLNPGKSKNV